MRVFTNLDDYQNSADSLILALGNFDGLHAGHQKLLQKTLEDARRAQVPSGVLTFQNHPQQILHPGSRPSLLTSFRHKMMLIEQTGIECCIALPFTQEFSQLSARVFIERILVGRLNVKKVLMGFNARFGRGREGNADVMRDYAADFGFEFEQLEPVQAAGKIVSSSRIRKLIEEGNLAEAAECLGRPYSVLGRVIRGDGRGKTLGFPTANLEVDSEILPPEGVYPAEVRILTENKWRRATVNYGKRPTFGQNVKPTLEAFILDFDQNLYDAQLELRFHPRLRPEMTFETPQSLKSQIARDVAATERYFAQL